MGQAWGYLQSPPEPLQQEEEGEEDNVMETFEECLCNRLTRKDYDDQLRTGLSARLPDALIDHILDYGSGYRSITRMTRGERQVHNGEVCPYIQFPVPDATWMKRYKVATVTITADSHDQGWSDHREDHGTYRGSWTWSDVTVTDIVPQEGDEERVMYKEEVYRNLHARRQWQHHVMKVGKDHDLVQAIKPGKLITMHCKALYPGWVHCIREASITISFLKTYE